MGRKTYESIPLKFRPLSGRMNVVVSRNPDCREALSLPDDVLVASSFEDALAQVSAPDLESTVSQVFVIGGGSIYEEAVRSPACARILLTTVDAPKELEQSCDVFFPKPDPKRFTLSASSKPVREGDMAFSFALFEQVQEPTPETPGDGAVDGGESSASPVDVSGDAQGSARPGDELLDQLLSGCDAAADTSGKLSLGVGAPVYSALSPGAAMVAGMAQHPEMQYLNLIRDIMANGVVRGDRTGTGTISKFGVQMRFSLRGDEFPLLTTKRVFWRGVAEELLWFVAGSTNAKLLQDKGIKIWDGNASREFLDGRGLSHREEGDLGPVYGFQWRHFGVSKPRRPPFSAAFLLLFCCFRRRRRRRRRRLLLVIPHLLPLALCA